MDAVVASMSAAYDAGYFHSGGHNVTLPEAKAIADVARDEFSKILDSYAKRMYIIAAFGGSQLTYSTQYIGPLDFDKTEYVMDATADPNAPIRSGKFTAPVKLNTWVMLPFQQINSRYTRNSNITELYGLVVGKTTIYSRENATRTINYQLDYVMSKADYTKYAHEHPIYFDYVGKKIEAV
jgi:hypothetical protein